MGLARRLLGVAVGGKGGEWVRDVGGRWMWTRCRVGDRPVCGIRGEIAKRGGVYQSHQLAFGFLVWKAVACKTLRSRQLCFPDFSTFAKIATRSHI